MTRKNTERKLNPISTRNILWTHKSFT